MHHYFPHILQQSPTPSPQQMIGHSREARPIQAWQFGKGSTHISLIAGCHADEPVGPRLVRKLVAFLQQLDASHELLQRYSWWLVPHVNPDGEAVNRAWYSNEDEVFGLGKYLQHVQRELPGDDVEFGFPIAGEIGALRPENQAVFDFWQQARSPFHLHATLHGMRSAYGPWYLMEASWAKRAQSMIQACQQQVKEMGYPLFDIDRKGEKGFSRIAEGFSTRPDSQAMRQYFHQRNDPETAAKFHPSSMESIRSLGGDCLSLVSEMPLFILPNNKPTLEWPHPDFVKWSEQFRAWTLALHTEKLSIQEVDEAAQKAGIKPMPISEQMKLQWGFICEGIQLVV